MTAPNGSTLHFERSTPTTSMWATRSKAREGSGMAALRKRATSALRPGATSKSSGVIPSFSRMPAMYFAAACSFPGGLVVSILTRSASQPSASLARAVVSGSGTCAGGTAGAELVGSCAKTGTSIQNPTASVNTRIFSLRLPFTNASSVRSVTLTRSPQQTFCSYRASY